MTQRPPFRCDRSGQDIIRRAAMQCIRILLSPRNLPGFLAMADREISRKTVRGHGLTPYWGGENENGFTSI